MFSFKAKDVARSICPPLLWRAASAIKRSRSSNLAGEIRREPTGRDLLMEDTCPDKRIYVHIHKCAGTSLYQTLRKYPGFICCVARPGNFPYRMGREYIDDLLWDKSFKFTFVRNPYARIVSAFKMFVMTEHSPGIFKNFDEFVEFLSWVNVDEHCVEEEIPIVEYTRKLDNIIHHCSSFHNPKYMIDEMNFIGRVESLEKDLQHIAAYFGMEHIELPQLNATRKDDYRDYYSVKSREIVATKYRRDIERFDYKF